MHHLGQGRPWPAPPGSPERALILAFASPLARGVDAALADLREAYPGVAIAGCSTAGDILDDSVRDDALTATLLSFEDTRVCVASTRVVDSGHSLLAGVVLAETLAADELAAVLVFSDGLHVNGTELARGLTRLPAGLVSGGLAGDGDRFGATWVVAGGEREEHMVTAVGLYGARLRTSSGSASGWEAFGPERVVTRSDGSVLHTLDGQPALGVYKRYLGELASGLPATALLFPLALRQSAAHEPVVRTVLAIDEDQGTMTFAGDIPVGWTAQLMRARLDSLVDGAEKAAKAARSLAEASEAPVFSLAISCVGRRLVLGERTEEELAATFGQLPLGSLQAGFYSYGELASTEGFCDLHNQTMTLTNIWEAPRCTSSSAAN